MHAHTHTTPTTHQDTKAFVRVLSTRGLWKSFKQIFNKISNFLCKSVDNYTVIYFLNKMMDIMCVVESGCTPFFWNIMLFEMFKFAVP